jgi:hypothetical protein
MSGETALCKGDHGWDKCREFQLGVARIIASLNLLQSVRGSLQEEENLPVKGAYRAGYVRMWDQKVFPSASVADTPL